MSLNIQNNAVMPHNQMVFKATKEVPFLLKHLTAVKNDLKRLGYDTSLMSDEMIIDLYRSVMKKTECYKSPNVDNSYNSFIRGKYIENPESNVTKRLSQEDAKRLGLTLKF